MIFARYTSRLLDLKPGIRAVRRVPRFQKFKSGGFKPPFRLQDWLPKVAFPLNRRAFARQEPCYQSGGSKLPGIFPVIHISETKSFRLSSIHMLFAEDCTPLEDTYSKHGAVAMDTVRFVEPDYIVVSHVMEYQQVQSLHADPTADVENDDFEAIRWLYQGLQPQRV